MRALLAAIGIDLLLVLAWTALSTVTAPVDSGNGALAILWGDDAQMGPESARRLRHVLSLWQRSGSNRLIFCGGGVRPAKGFSGAALLCGWLAEAGVPKEDLAIGRGSNDSVSNLAELATLARSLGTTHVVIVASPMQTLRMRAFLGSTSATTVSFGWAPYSYADALPSISILDLWLAAHREWLAILSLLLPSNIRREILSRLRG
jgi:uncharacterized SAM-binding protein YcdF (DUF218 family)